MRISGISLAEANAFVERLHRHHGRAVGHKWSLAAYKDGRLCGVAIVGRPSGRYLDDGKTLEVVRAVDIERERALPPTLQTIRWAVQAETDKLRPYLRRIEKALKAAGNTPDD